MLTYCLEVPAQRMKDNSAALKEWKFPWEKGESQSSCPAVKTQTIPGGLIPEYGDLVEYSGN